MHHLIDLTRFCRGGQAVMCLLLAGGVLLGLSGLVNLVRSRPVLELRTYQLLVVVTGVFAAGFVWICGLHWQIYWSLPLEMPDALVSWFNQHRQHYAGSGLPQLEPGRPCRYTVPLWIESEKYYFWFLCYSVLALVAHRRLPRHRLRALVHLLLAVQIVILFFAADPFAHPLPAFFSEIRPWFDTALRPLDRLRLFMGLYPRMVYYYNAAYMWLHPPMLFLSYACITITGVTSVGMLAVRDRSVEETGYVFARLGFVLLSLGMLLGYPWALQAWGDNWWWDPKVCSSIMLWVIYSAYLHTRLHAARRGMWYFTAVTGVLCFAAMVFTLLSSLYFPGEHTMR